MLSPLKGIFQTVLYPEAKVNSLKYKPDVSLLCLTPIFLRIKSKWVSMVCQNLQSLNPAFRLTLAPLPVALKLQFHLVSPLNVGFLLLLGFCTFCLLCQGGCPAYAWLTSVYPSRSLLGHQVLKAAFSISFPHKTGCNMPVRCLHST